MIDKDLFEFAKSFEFSNYRELREIRLMVQQLAKKEKEIDFMPKKSTANRLHVTEANKQILCHRISTKQVNEIKTKLLYEQQEVDQSSESEVSCSIEEVEYEEKRQYLTDVQQLLISINNILKRFINIRAN